LALGMMKTSSWLLVTAMLALQAMPSCALACSYPEPRPFSELIQSASSIFIFRLESSELKHEKFPGGAYSEWTEGRIRVTQSLKGNASLFRSVTFSTDWCGGLRLDVGHYFLVVTTDRGPTLKLRPSDLSIIDVTMSYDAARPLQSAKNGLLKPISDYLDGKPLPVPFPPEDVAALTSSLPPPPPRSRADEHPQLMSNISFEADGIVPTL